MNNGNLWLIGALSATLGACTISGRGPNSDNDDGGEATSTAGTGGGAAAGSADASSSGSGAASSGAGAGSADSGLAVLGNTSHGRDAVVVEELGTAADGLDEPSDVAFHPTSGELWVTNHANDSVTIFSGLGTPSQSASTRHDSDSSRHFLANPSGLAFSANGTMATIHEEDQPTQGNATPWDFMGPTLWPSSSSAFDGGHESHLDMLHNSPNGMGIAWEAGNAYWVFDGEHASLTRYDFHGDHGPGGSDHSDGEVARYVAGEVARAPGVPSNLVFDSSTNSLYVADTGNNRIAVLDASSGSRGGFVGPDYDGAEQFVMVGATLTTLIDGADYGLGKPSGLALRDGVLFVTDHATSTIYGFDTEGNLLDWLDMALPPGCLAGLTTDSAGNLVVADIASETVVRISPR